VQQKKKTNPLQPGKRKSKGRVSDADGSKKILRREAQAVIRFAPLKNVEKAGVTFST